LEGFDAYGLLFSIRGVLYIFIIGILAILSSIIQKQKKKIDMFEENISIIEPLLRAIIERQDTPQDMKVLAKETIEKIKTRKE
jgi:hypothetical protein